MLIGPKIKEQEAQGPHRRPEAYKQYRPIKNNCVFRVTVMKKLG